MSGGRLVVAVTSGASRVDEATLAGHFDAESATVADPAAVRETLGWAGGRVPPFCHDESVLVAVDPALEAHETVWAAPTAVFPMAPADLVAHADAETVAFT